VAALSAILLSACGNDEESDERPINDAQSDNDTSIDGSGTESDASGCEGATDRFWPDTADCDPACYHLVEGLMFDETRECYGPSAELSTPLACLRDGTAGASLSCHTVPGLGQVMTLNVYFSIGDVFDSCPMPRRPGFPCTE
jgi:hypothetical protein